MSTLETTRSGSFRGIAPTQGLGMRLLRLLNTAAEGVSVMLERRRSRLMLLELTEDQLKDIGLSRADAEREGLRRPWQ